MQEKKLILDNEDLNLLMSYIKSLCEFIRGIKKDYPIDVIEKPIDDINYILTIIAQNIVRK